VRIDQKRARERRHHFAPFTAEAGVVAKTLVQIEGREFDIADAFVAAIEIGPHAHAIE
jgi:hypothetical protein